MCSLQNVVWGRTVGESTSQWVYFRAMGLGGEKVKSYKHIKNINVLSYNDWVNQFKYKLQQTLHQWIDLAGAKADHLLRSLRDKANQWWYFLNYPEVPPDNNQAERSLRLAVTKRSC